MWALILFKTVWVTVGIWLRERMNFSILYLVFSSVYVTKHLLLLIEVSVIGPQMSDDILAPGCAVDGGFLRCGALCCFPWAHAEQVRCGGVDLSSFGRSLGILV